ncbi:MAG: hypothetical protein BWY74_02336 [Firmicutes bacterium ADurb.Bin419]|jgi:hypothetical protein|nr:MAG: hypothetical protein BWY74_02336 [Firmicutes bacterium ADurb.Bin419]
MIIDLIDFGRDKINTELELSNGDLIDAMRDVSKNIYIYQGAANLGCQGV